MTLAIALVLSTAFTALSATSWAQLLANDYLSPPPPAFNDTLYLAGPGGFQRVLYEDAQSDVVTNMVWIEIHIYPCGLELPQIHPGFTELSYILQGTVVGGLSNPETGRTGHQTFSAPAVVAVQLGQLHSAENPSCTEEVILQQAQSGGPRFQHTDILSALLGMSASSVQYGYNLPNGQVQAAATSMTPVFAYNKACLARCGLSAPGPGAGPFPAPTVVNVYGPGSGPVPSPAASIG